MKQRVLIVVKAYERKREEGQKVSRERERKREREGQGYSEA